MHGGSYYSAKQENSWSKVIRMESPAESLLIEAAVRWAKANRKAFARTVKAAEMFPGEKNPVTVFMAGSPGAGKTEASKAGSGANVRALSTAFQISGVVRH